MSAALLAAVAGGGACWLLLPGTPSASHPDHDPTRAWVPAAVVALGVAVLALPRALAAPGLVLAVGAWGARLLWRRRTAARLAEANSARTVEVCDLLAAELSAGRPTEAALDAAASAWSVIRPVAEAGRLGGDVPAAFRAASRTPGARGLRLLAGAWAVSQRTGGGLGAATRRAAEAVRREQATRRVVAGELASARATARLMAGLPVVALLMGSGAGADPWTFLFGSPGGWACLVAGGATGFAGLWWIELIAREVDA